MLTTYFPGISNPRNHKGQAYEGPTFKAGVGFGTSWRINLEDAPFGLPPPLLAVGFDGTLRRVPASASDGIKVPHPTGEWFVKRHSEYSMRAMGLWKLPLLL